MLLTALGRRREGAHSEDERGTEIKERDRHPHERAGGLLVCERRNKRAGFGDGLAVNDAIAKDQKR